MITVVVIGGGAAGMMAALEAASRGAAVSLFERQSRVGRKLAVTGNGRCNLSNIHASPAFYHGGDRAFTGYALKEFGPKETLAYFKSLGLVTAAQADGRVYPLSDTAGSVVDVLRLSMEAAGVKLHDSCEVSRLEKTKTGYRLIWQDGSLEADRVIVACGGMAGERFGGTRLGYRLLEQMGHHCTPLRWSLVQLRSDNPGCRSLKGIRADAGVSVRSGGKTVASSVGEVQFTDYGLSGPAIFEVSRAALERTGTVVVLDLLRDVSEEELVVMLLRRARNTPQLTLGDAFVGTVQNRIGRVLVAAAGLKASASIVTLDERTSLKLARLAKHFEFSVTGDMGAANAQVTVGGIITSEFNAETMESRRCPGLYACGEVLDIDGDCGGYNLQWAWSSGRLAGRSAAEV
jgi:predicted Rossmann fold flavoprotein